MDEKPPPFDVELHPHSSAWAGMAEAERTRLKGALGVNDNDLCALAPLVEHAPQLHRALVDCAKLSVMPLAYEILGLPGRDNAALVTLAQRER